MTKTVIEAAFAEEIADHLGYDTDAVEGRNKDTVARITDRTVQARGRVPNEQSAMTTHTW